MDRRPFQPLLAAVCAWACALLPGCDPMHRQTVRKDVAASDDDAKSEQDALRGMHDSSGSSGAWSRRAREIESHFNIQ